MTPSVPIPDEAGPSEHGMNQTEFPESERDSGMLSGDAIPPASSDAFPGVIVKLCVSFQAVAPGLSHQYQEYASHQCKASKEGFVKNADTPLLSLGGLAVMISLLP